MLTADPFAPARQAATDWVRANWNPDAYKAVMDHTFPALVIPDGSPREQIAAGRDWRASVKTEVAGVPVRSSRALYHAAKKSGRPVRLGDVDPNFYERHMYDRYRYEIVFLSDLEAMGLPSSGIEDNGDGTVNYYAPDGMGRATMVMENEPKPDDMD